MSENLCLICCYSFQEKQNRFISDEARESFGAFSKQLGCPFNSLSRRTTPGGRGSSLNLPFGDRITVCGDCLSLVAVYIQRRSVQLEKEERLLKLQQEVCKAVYDLSSVVEDVQFHVNQLQGTVRMGDASKLGQFISRSCPQSAKRQKESQANLFREKVLTRLSTGAGAFRRQDVRRPKKDERILITSKVVEPVDSPKMSSFWNEEGNNFMDMGAEDNPSATGSEASVSTPTKARKTRCNINSQNVSVRKVENEEEEPWGATGEESFQDFSDSEMYPNEEDLQESGEENDFRDEDWTIQKTDRFNRKYGFGKVNHHNLEIFNFRCKRPPLRGSAKVKNTFPRRKGLSKKYGQILDVKQAAEWKSDVFSRIMAQAPHEQTKLSRFEGGESNNEPPPNYEIINGNLQVGEVSVRVVEPKRMLECTRCFKQFYEERDGLRIETLMRNHILEKHYLASSGKLTKPSSAGKAEQISISGSRPVPSSSRPVEMEVIPYSSQTKSKKTHKLADSNRYAYNRRQYRGDAAPAYYRCDYRKGGCSASILLRNGKYYRLVKGWNEDGTHTVHAPDKELTNKMMAYGMAKDMYLNDPSITIDEVISTVMQRVGVDETVVPLMRLKRALRMSKHRSRGMAPEEKMNQPDQQCSYCGRVYKNGRGLTRHLNTAHQEQEYGIQKKESETSGSEFPSNYLTL